MRSRLAALARLASLGLIALGGSAAAPVLVSAAPAAQGAGDAISFSGTQIIAAVSVLITGITGLFWLLLAAKDAQLKEAQEHNKTLTAELAKAREESSAVSNRLMDRLEGAIKTSELAIKESSVVLGQQGTALGRLIENMSAEHEQMIEALRSLGANRLKSVRTAKKRAGATA